MDIESIDDATEVARARLNQTLIECLLADFAREGAGVIAWLRLQRPQEYVRLVSLAMPDAPGKSRTDAPRSRFNLLARLFAPHPATKARSRAGVNRGDLRAQLDAELIEKGTKHDPA